MSTEALYVPGAHERHGSEALGLNSPATHATQEVAEVELAKDPGVQDWQGMAGLLVKVPERQTVQADAALPLKEPGGQVEHSKALAANWPATQRAH